MSVCIVEFVLAVEGIVDPDSLASVIDELLVGELDPPVVALFAVAVLVVTKFVCETAADCGRGEGVPFVELASGVGGEVSLQMGARSE